MKTDATSSQTDLRTVKARRTYDFFNTLKISFPNMLNFHYFVIIVFKLDLSRIVLFYSLYSLATTWNMRSQFKHIFLIMYIFCTTSNKQAL